MLRPTAFIIRPDMPGFRVVGTVRKMGIRGSTQAELAYDGLHVPADHVLGTRRQGIRRRRERAERRAPDARRGLHGGHARRILRQMSEFAEQRVQFGRPIADFEITQRKIARTATRRLRRRTRCSASSRGWPSRAGRRVRARGGVLQGVRERDALARRRRDGAGRGRARVREAVSVRAAAARRAHQPDLRGHERDPAAVHRAQRHPGSGGGAEGARRRAAAAAEEPRPALGVSRRRASAARLGDNADARRRAARAAQAARRRTSRSTSPSSTDRGRAA